MSDAGSLQSAGTSGGSNAVVSVLAELLKATVTRDNLGALRPVRAIDGGSMEGVFAAYDQLPRVAQKIQDAMTSKLGDKREGKIPVLLQAGDEVAPLVEYRGFLRQMQLAGDRLEDEIKDAEDALNPPKEPGDPPKFWGGLVVAVASAAVQLFTFFARVDVTEKHATVAIDDRTMLMAMYQELEEQNTAYVPLHPASLALSPAADAGEDKAGKRLPAQLRALEKRAQRLRDLRATIEARLAPKVGENGAPDQATRERLTSAKARADAAVKAVDDFAAATNAGIARLLQADMIEARLGTTGLILAVRVLHGGSTERTATQGNDAQTETSGGVLVSYVVFKSDGTILISGLTRAIGPMAPEPDGLALPGGRSPNDPTAAEAAALRELQRRFGES